MTSLAVSRCYLCGTPISGDPATGDHAVPTLLIERAQPKVKGFDYGGTLPTHAKCNNEFGPETYCARALQLLPALYDPKCVKTVPCPHNPRVKMMALNVQSLSRFTPQECEFFKVIDLSSKSTSEWADPSLYPDEKRADPRRVPRDTALAVLVKSSAALLIKRHLRDVPARWRIMAMPYVDETGSFDLETLVGATKPFDIGVKVWLKPVETGDWFAIYQAQRFIVFLLFSFSAHDLSEKMRTTFPDTDRLLFEGRCLNDLLGHSWAAI